jgi:hypothetical protein
VPVVLLIIGLVVLVVVVYVATGRGGELPAERTDHAPLDLGPVSATDVALLRPPSAMWGYDMQATDEALDRIAETIRERDVRIIALEQLVTDLGRNPAPVRLGNASPDARHRRDIVEPPARTGAAAPPETLAAAPTAEPAPAPGPAPHPEPGRGRERATSAPPTWPLTPMRSVSTEVTRPQAAQPRSPQPRSPEQPEQPPGAQEPGQRQQQPPPERSHG